MTIMQFQILSNVIMRQDYIDLCKSSRNKWEKLW